MGRVDERLAELSITLTDPAAVMVVPVRSVSAVVCASPYPTATAQLLALPTPLMAATCIEELAVAVVPTATSPAEVSCDPVRVTVAVAYFSDGPMSSTSTSNTVRFSPSRVS